ncbi:hypothetical protein GALMADRAFT_224295 [Galerina marginata CBS 339.88]|uniref:YEATS domain-containing protein n=1 Tax=Galerina marginata (strain CBS 339.88) TaxID=685588 RepID=A0A067TGL3_GALM3|nr:hypothetical protein GALMADRAFT_224295 [Galerina marginata CBS 339.88]
MPATKRRKLSSQDGSADITESFLSEVTAEIETEIALKQQLTGTLESRIAWALMLQESIKEESRTPSQDTYRSVALEALSVVEQTFDHILCRDPIAPPSIHIDRAARPAPRKVVPFNFKTKPSFLYIRSDALVNGGDGQNHLYLLRCPACARTRFTSLQGLLNHARLTHNLEWGTHDECIRACAVVDDELDVDSGIEVGLGPGGVLPGLRTIFEMAVGTPSIREDTVGFGTAPISAGAKAPSSAANHLIQTLGFHGDSPALAPFLGKEVVRRQIKVCEEDCEVDFESVPAFSSQRHSRPWKMSFTPRNFAEYSEEDSGNGTLEFMDPPKGDMGFDKGGIVRKPENTENVISGQSRFHFMTRIIITDRSLWIPVDQRAEGQQIHSHKWMISVDSPSYTHHITTVLNSVQVTPSDPSVSIPTPPVTSSPPFVVVGFSDRPFLARVELSFSGAVSRLLESGLAEQKVVFEHWIELDPLNGQAQFTGQDQVVDVELDKNTVLKSPQLGYTPIGAKSLWNQVIEPRVVLKTKEERVIQDLWQLSEAARSLLDRLVKQFPMTLSNAKGPRSQASMMPYTLMNSPAELSTLVVGRRKAIEWGRSRAIQDAYNRKAKYLQDQTIMTLSVADVYSWLSDNGHFLRKKEFKKETHIKQQIPGIKLDEGGQLQEQGPHWCRTCGLEANIHSRTVPKKEVLEDGGLPREPDRRSAAGVSTIASDEGCHIVSRVLHVAKLPRTDIRKVHPIRDPRLNGYQSAKFTILHGVSLSPSADPSLTWSIHKLVQDLDLSKFRPSMEPEPADAQRQLLSFPLEEFGRHRMEVDRNLGPLGLLALVTGQFLRVLVNGGLEVADRDKVIASCILPSERVSERAFGKKVAPRILTPTHILSGILTRGRNLTNSFDTVVLSSLSRLGVDVDSDGVTRCRQGEAEARVKLEE